jgi:anthranilate phosphoribosyltransferase
MLSWLREFWWAGRNHKFLTTLLHSSGMQMRSNAQMLRHMTQENAALIQEVRRLKEQGEHDALMIQAFVNWCAANGCSPTEEQLQKASGKKG